MLQASDLQLVDEVVIQFRNGKVMKSAPTKLLGVCRLTVGDIYSSIVHLYREQLKDVEANLSEQVFNSSTAETGNTTQSVTTRGTQRKTLIIPAPQEYSLFRPAKVKRAPLTGDIFEVIKEEMDSIQKKALEALDSDSVGSNDSDSFLGLVGKKAKDEDRSKMVKSNERLFGSISLSFFPVL